MTSLPSAPSEREHLTARLDPWWVDGALRAIAALAESGVTFSADDLRADPYSLPEPPHCSHWGSLFTIARAEGLIEPTGFILSTTPSRKGGVLRTWQAASARAVIAA